MSCAGRQNLYAVVMGASIPTGACSGLDESSVRRTRTLRRIEERPCFTLEGVFNPSWSSKDTRSGILPTELGAVPINPLCGVVVVRGNYQSAGECPYWSRSHPVPQMPLPIEWGRGH